MSMLIMLAQDGGGIMGGGIVMILIMLIVLAAFAFWLWMLIDAITNQSSGTDKLIWVLVILFLNLLGAILYYFIGRNKSRTV